MRRSRFRLDLADGVMLAVVLLWATNNIIIKRSLDAVAPLSFVVGRFVIVLGLVWAWIALRRLPARLRRRDVPAMAVAGITGFGIYSALFTVGMDRTSAFAAALLVSLSPVFTLILARIGGIERPTPAQWLAVALAVTGVALFVGDTARVKGLGAATSGDLLGVLAAFSFAVYSIVARPLTARYGATVTTGWSVASGLAAIAPWGVPAAIDEPWLDLSLPFWIGLVYAGAVAMLIGYTLWSWAMARGGVARTAPYLFLIPVLTGILAALALRETFSAAKLAGAMMVLAGTTLVRVLGGSGRSHRMRRGRRPPSRGGSDLGRADHDDGMERGDELRAAN